MQAAERRNGHKDSIDRLIARLIRRQKGVITRAQLLDLGLSSSSITRRLASRALIPLLPCTYIAPSVPASFQQRVIAAVLWAGEDAVASHRTAAHLWRLLDGKEEMVEINVSRALRSPAPWLKVHRSPITTGEIRRLEGVYASSVDRTLFDLGSVLTPIDLEEALECALRRGLTDVGRLGLYVADHSGMGKRGGRALKKLLLARGEQPATESRFETEFFALLRRARLPLPERQLVVTDADRIVGRIDFAYPNARVAIETDSWRFHSGRQAWQADAAKGNDLLALGWKVLRFTYQDLKQRPAWVIDCIRRALGQTLF